MRSVRVLHVITACTLLGGAQRNTLLTVEGLRRRGYDVELASGPGEPMVEAARRLGVPLTIFPSMVRNISPLRDIRCLFENLRLLSRHAFDIVHTHSTKAGIIARFAARHAGVPIIVHTIHGTPFRRELSPVLNRVAMLLERAAASGTDRLIAVAELIKQEFLAARICSPEVIETIYSGIDFTDFDIDVDVDQKKRRLGIPLDHDVVGTVGHLLEHKGHIYLIEAAERVLRTIPNVTFLIAGEGRYRAETVAAIVARGLERRVLLLGARDDVPELLRVMDVYVQPSIAEGLGRSVTEALYTRRAVVATAVNAVPELIEHDRTGLLVPPRSSRAIADAIAHLLAHPDTRRVLGNNGHHRVFSEFSSVAMLDRIDSLYRRLLDERTLAGHRRRLHRPLLYVNPRMPQ